MSNRRRVHKQPPSIWVYRHTFKSAAWEALSVGARATYVELAANYNTKMRNAVYLAARTGAKRLGVNKDTVTKWLRELQHYGFIVLVRGGSLGVEGYGLAQTFRLTDRPYGNAGATYDFQNWTGEIFNPQKHFPVRKNRTPRPKKPDIEKSGQQSSLCPKNPDIETAPDRPKNPDATSLAIYQGLEADAVGPAHAPIGHNAGPPLEPEPVIIGLNVWTTPILTEIPYTDELRRLYRNAAPTDDGLDIPEFLRRV